MLFVDTLMETLDIELVDFGEGRSYACNQESISLMVFYMVEPQWL